MTTTNNCWHDVSGAHVADVTETAWNAAVADNFSDYDASTKPYRNSVIDQQGLAIRTCINNRMSIDEDAIAFFEDDNNNASGVIASNALGNDEGNLGVVSDQIFLRAQLPPNNGGYISGQGGISEAGQIGFNSDEYKEVTIDGSSILIIADDPWYEADEYRYGEVRCQAQAEGSTQQGLNDLSASWTVNATYHKKDADVSETHKNALLAMNARDDESNIFAAADKIDAHGTIMLTNGTAIRDNGSFNLHILTSESRQDAQANFTLEGDGHIYARTRTRANAQWSDWSSWSPIDTAGVAKIVTQDIVVPSTDPGYNASGGTPAATVTHGNIQYQPIAVLDWWWLTGNGNGARENWFQNYGVHFENGNIYYRFLNNHSSLAAYGKLRVRMLYLRTGVAA